MNIARALEKLGAALHEMGRLQEAERAGLHQQALAAYAEVVEIRRWVAQADRARSSPTSPCS
jgi:hypothetical protein